MTVRYRPESYSFHPAADNRALNVQPWPRKPPRDNDGHQSTHLFLDLMFPALLNNLYSRKHVSLKGIFPGKVLSPSTVLFSLWFGSQTEDIAGLKM